MAGGHACRRWHVNGSAQAIGQLGVIITPTLGAYTVEAEYCDHAAGGYSTYGVGCTGSNGLVPSHGSASAPEIGQLVTHQVTDLRAFAPAVMFLGFSKTTWNGLPLPLSLGLIGADPACNVLAGGFLQLPMPVDGAGSGSLTFRVTGSASAIGMHTFTQVIAADLFLPHPVPLVVSNGSTC